MLRPVVVSLIVAAGAAVAAQAPDLATVSRIGDYVEQYYARAQSLLVDETVVLTTLSASYAPVGFARRLRYELRLERDSGDTESPAKLSRRLVAVNGKPPRPGELPRCTDPVTVSPEPMAFLLPGRRDEFEFRVAGQGRAGDRPAVMIDYRSRRPEAPVVEWNFRGDDECAQLDTPGRSRGRVWADPETHAILRLDERLIGMVDFRVPSEQQRQGGWPAVVTLQQAETSIRYKEVRFVEPDERLMLPAEITNMIVIQASGTSRRLVTQTFTNYRRFVTGSRILP